MNLDLGELLRERAQESAVVVDEQQAGHVSSSGMMRAAIMPPTVGRGEGQALGVLGRRRPDLSDLCRPPADLPPHRTRDGADLGHRLGVMGPMGRHGDPIGAV